MSIPNINNYFNDTNSEGLVKKMKKKKNKQINFSWVPGKADYMKMLFFNAKIRKVSTF